MVGRRASARPLYAVGIRPASPRLPCLSSRRRPGSTIQQPICWPTWIPAYAGMTLLWELGIAADVRRDAAAARALAARRWLRHGDRGGREGRRGADRKLRG